MKSILGTMAFFLLLLSFDSLAKMGGNDFKAATVVAKHQCGRKLNDYNFEKVFKNLFNYSYLNRDMSKVKKISLKIEKQMKEICEKNKYLAGGWNQQECYHSCHDNFDVKELLAEQCLATCSSLAHQMNSLVNEVAAMMNDNLVSVDECNLSDSHINNSSRNVQKDIPVKTEKNLKLKKATAQ